jgi:hypothetical protein
MTMGLLAMTADRCPDCGALYVLVGIRHRCTPRTTGLLARLTPKQRKAAVAVDPPRVMVGKPPKVKKNKPK